MTIKSDQTTCQVRAPDNLPEGYQFNATVDGKDFTVTVPAGGVEKDQIIEVPYPQPTAPIEEAAAVQNEAVTTTTTSSSMPVASLVVASKAPAVASSSLAPTGRWRNDICDCFNVCCTGVWWMGWCCGCILTGQVMQRLKLNTCGKPGPYESTCQMTLVIVAIFWVLYVILAIVGAAGVGIVLLYVLVIYLVFIGTCTRIYMRRKYNIPPDCCGEGCLGDCCCAYWCGCCSAIQMHRHTHDENTYQYNCCGATGIERGAPEIV